MIRKQLLLSSLALALVTGAGHASATASCGTVLNDFFSSTAEQRDIAADVVGRITHCGDSAPDVVTAAIKANPGQAIAITLAAIDAAPDQISEIVAAAVEAAPDQAEEIVASITDYQPTAAGSAVGSGPAFSPSNMPRGGSGGGSGGGITASSS